MNYKLVIARAEKPYFREEIRFMSVFLAALEEYRTCSGVEPLNDVTLSYGTTTHMRTPGDMLHITLGLNSVQLIEGRLSISEKIARDAVLDILQPRYIHHGFYAPRITAFLARKVSEEPFTIGVWSGLPNFDVMARRISIELIDSLARLYNTGVWRQPTHALPKP